MAAPARKSQLVSTSAVKETHFGSSGSKVGTFQCKRGSGSEVATFSTSVVKEIHFGSSG